jgi:hypothetical protein
MTRNVSKLDPIKTANESSGLMIKVNDTAHIETTIEKIAKAGPRTTMRLKKNMPMPVRMQRVTFTASCEFRVGVDL